MFNDFLERIYNEPALVGAALLAIGNLFGTDLTDQTEWVESVVVLIVGWIIRQQVTPVRKLESSE